MNLICFQNIPLHILFYYITAKNRHLSEAVEFIEKESMKEQKDLKIWGTTRQTVAIGKSVKFSYPPHIVFVRNKNNIYQGPNIVSLTYKNIID